MPTSGFLHVWTCLLFIPFQLSCRRAAGEGAPGQGRLARTWPTSPRGVGPGLQLAVMTPHALLAPCVMDLSSCPLSWSPSGVHFSMPLKVLLRSCIDSHYPVVHRGCHPPTALNSRPRCSLSISASRPCACSCLGVSRAGQARSGQLVATFLGLCALGMLAAVLRCHLVAETQLLGTPSLMAGEGWGRGLSPQDRQSLGPPHPAMGELHGGWGWGVSLV